MSPSDASSRTFSRRGFLGTTLGSALAGSALPAVAGLVPGEPQPKAGPKARIREYRTLGRTGAKVSDVSFGAGNLTNANVLAEALARGITYIDTAEHYMNGNSERAIGEALKGRDRKSVFITTKLNLSFNKGVSKEDLKERFRKCLERMGTSYADCLMIHMCTLAQVKHEPYHEAIRELKAEGRVRFTGLSNHGADLSLYGRLEDPMDKVLLAAAEDGRFDVALFVYNYLRTDTGDVVLEACKAKGMGVTLMKMDPAFYIEPDQEMIRERLERYAKEGKEVPEGFKALIKQAELRAEKTRTFLKKHNLSGAEQSRGAAIAFCLASPLVHCVCPSMNSFEDLEAFLALSGQRMKKADRALLTDLTDLAGTNYCRHACGTCEASCPRDVAVNTIMRYDYYFQAKGMEKHAMGQYAALGARDASACDACAGPCVAACPHGVPIQGKLILAHDTLSLG